MQLLQLRIKEVYLNEIVLGQKTSEFRAFSDFYIARICQTNESGEIQPKKFDAVKLYLGNEKNSKYAIVQISGIYINQYFDEIPKGMNKGDMEFEIELGKILETNIS